MMRPAIEQRRAFKTIRAQFEADGVSIEEKGPFGAYHARIAYEEIPDHTIDFTEIPRGWLFATVVTLALFGVALEHFLTTSGASVQPLLWTLGAGALAGFFTWSGSASYIGFRCPSCTLLFFDQTGPGSPQPFLAELRRRRSEYFREFSDGFGGDDELPSDPGSRTILH